MRASFDYPENYPRALSASAVHTSLQRKWARSIVLLCLPLLLAGLPSAYAQSARHDSGHRPEPSQRPAYPGAPSGYNTPPVIIQVPDSVFTTPAPPPPEPRPSTRLEWGSGWKELGSTRSARERIHNEPYDREYTAPQRHRSDETSHDTQTRPPGTE